MSRAETGYTSRILNKRMSKNKKAARRRDFFSEADMFSLKDSSTPICYISVNGLVMPMKIS